jgi:hypothetical protein
MRPRSCEDWASEPLSTELLSVGVTIVGGVVEVEDGDDPVVFGAVLAGAPEPELEPELDLFFRAHGGRSDCDCACSADAASIARAGRQTKSARRVKESVGRMRY